MKNLWKIIKIKRYVIYKHKKYPLQKLLSCQNFKNDKLKIMMLLSKDCYNKSCMFKDCSLLMTFKCDYNINSMKDSLFKSENIYYLSNFLWRMQDSSPADPVCCKM